MIPSLRSALVAALLAVSGSQAIPQAEWTPTPSPTPSSTADSGATVSEGTSCNNSPNLCDRQYNNVTYLGAHDSAFLRDDSTDNSISGNQYLNATKALDAGLRFLQAQVHDQDGTLELCHSSCSLLDAGSLQDWLALISDWMAGNPNDVVTILLVNADSKDADTFGQAFNGSGIADYAYTPTTTEATSQWPTLGNMISNNQRLVTFITNIDPTTNYPYIMSEFDYIFETAYEITELTGFNCTLDRPSRLDSAANALSSSYMSLVNHFKYQGLGSDILLPDVDSIDVVNSASTSTAGNLGLHLQDCTSEFGTIPNFVLVDFWSAANPLDAVDNTNDLSEADIKGRTAASSDDDDDNAAISLNGNMGRGALLAFFAAALMLV